MEIDTKLESSEVMPIGLDTDTVILDLKSLLDNDICLSNELDSLGETIKRQNMKLENMMACKNSCAVSCTVTCADACSGSCTGACIDLCSGSCVGTCGGNCTSCTNDCNASCGSGCDNTCSGH